MMSSSQVSSWRVKTQSKPLRTKHIARTCDNNDVFYSESFFFITARTNMVSGKVMFSGESDPLVSLWSYHWQAGGWPSTEKFSCTTCNQHIVEVNIIGKNFQRIEFLYLGCMRLESVQTCWHVLINNDSENTYHKWEDNRDRLNCLDDPQYRQTQYLKPERHDRWDETDEKKNDLAPSRYVMALIFDLTVIYPQLWQAKNLNWFSIRVNKPVWQ